MARAKDFDLAAELAKPSFTAGQRDIPRLVELVIRGDEPAAPRAATALAKLGDAARTAIATALDAATDEAAKARLVGALGLHARGGDVDARAAVLARMQDPSSRVRRAAIGVLGKLGGDDARAALIARWDGSDVMADERRALAEALGKVGGDEALARLRQIAPAQDHELARRRDRALLMADRSARRDEPSEIVAEVAPPSPVRVVLGCRPGLAPLLVEELTACKLAPTLVDDAHAELALAGPLSTLFASRLWASCAIRLPFELPRVTGSGDRVSDPDALATAIVRAIASPATRALLAAWTRGPIRWRLGFAHGHKRSIVWRVARDVTAAAPELVNDPTATTWDVRVDEQAGTIALVPRKLDDPRFRWRIVDVPAASHPTVAAALAWVAEVRARDRVWDPFCGSGAELVERALRGPVRSLAGSDLDPDAVEATRRNIEQANLACTVAVADARTHAPGPVDLVITNPPLGSRVQVDAGRLLVEALPNLARQLAPGGRLVWITPAYRKTTPVAEQLGLRQRRWLRVDLGGVRGHLERWDR